MVRAGRNRCIAPARSGATRTCETILPEAPALKRDMDLHGSLFVRTLGGSSSVSQGSTASGSTDITSRSSRTGFQGVNGIKISSERPQKKSEKAGASKNLSFRNPSKLNHPQPEGNTSKKNERARSKSDHVGRKEPKIRTEKISFTRSFPLSDEVKLLIIPGRRETEAIKIPVFDVELQANRSSRKLVKRSISGPFHAMIDVVSDQPGRLFP